jgi:hypothetical protein
MCSTRGPKTLSYPAVNQLHTQKNHEAIDSIVSSAYFAWSISNSKRLHMRPPSIGPRSTHNFFILWTEPRSRPITDPWFSRTHVHDLSYSIQTGFLLPTKLSISFNLRSQKKKKKNRDGVRESNTWFCFSGTFASPPPGYVTPPWPSLYGPNSDGIYLYVPSSWAFFFLRIL